MKKCFFEKTSFSENRDALPVINVSIGYPQIEGCDIINSFYDKWVSHIKDYAAKFAGCTNGSGSVCPVRNVRIIPFLRFVDDSRIDITFDVIISEGGKLRLYKRTAHSWNVLKQRLIKSKKHGKETFFDGETTVVIENLFGKIETKRISEYVREIKQKK